MTEKKNQGYFVLCAKRIIKLTRLSPRVTHAIITGVRVVDLTMDKTRRGIPDLWSE